MRWIGHGRNKYTQFLLKNRKRLPQRPMNRLNNNNNTETDPKETGCKDVHLIELAQPISPTLVSVSGIS